MPNRLEQLKQWEREMQFEQEEVSRSLEPLLKRKDELRQKLDLIRTLLDLEREQATAELHPDSAGSPSIDTSPRNVGVGFELQEAVKEILKASGRAMHVSEIRAALLERGQPIPGKGTDANIIVHLRRAPDTFESKKRGTYGLVADDAASRKLRRD